MPTLMKMNDLPPWLGLAGLLAVLDWCALWFNWPRANLITKPAVMLALLGGFTFISGWHGRLGWFGMALLFSLLGDIFLLWKGAFMGGLVAFLMAHICFIALLNPSPLPLTPLTAIFTLVVWLLAMLLFRQLQTALRKYESLALLQFPLLVYILALSVMLLSALGTLARPDWPPLAAALVAAGGVLFTTSDALLSINRFVRRVPRGQFWVRIPYHLAQIALTAGILLRYIA